MLSNLFDPSMEVPTPSRENNFLQISRGTTPQAKFEEIFARLRAIPHMSELPPQMAQHCKCQAAQEILEHLPDFVGGLRLEGGVTAQRDYRQMPTQDKEPQIWTREQLDKFMYDLAAQIGPRA